MTGSSRKGFSSSVSVVEYGLPVHEPIQHLLDCHERIERSLRIVQDAVSSLALSEPVLRAEAAAALDYELALLQVLAELHTQDEEQSLFPRLRANLSEDPFGLRELMQNLESQHREKEAAFEEVADSLRNFSAKPGARAEEQLARLEGLVGRLADLYRPHITLENERLIPNCRPYLTPADLEGMQREMRLRFRA